MIRTWREEVKECVQIGLDWHTHSKMVIEQQLYTTSCYQYEPKLLQNRQSFHYNYLNLCTWYYTTVTTKVLALYSGRRLRITTRGDRFTAGWPLIASAVWMISVTPLATCFDREASACLLLAVGFWIVWKHTNTFSYGDGPYIGRGGEGLQIPPPH